MFCVNCGANIADDAAFCNNCGNRVERISDETPVQNNFYENTPNDEPVFTAEDVMPRDLDSPRYDNTPVQKPEISAKKRKGEKRGRRNEKLRTTALVLAAVSTTLFFAVLVNYCNYLFDFFDSFELTAVNGIALAFLFFTVAGILMWIFTAIGKKITPVITVIPAILYIAGYVIMKFAANQFNGALVIGVTVVMFLAAMAYAVSCVMGESLPIINVIAFILFIAAVIIHIAFVVIYVMNYSEGLSAAQLCSDVFVSFIPPAILFAAYALITRYYAKEN